MHFIFVLTKKNPRWSQPKLWDTRLGGVYKFMSGFRFFPNYNNYTKCRSFFFFFKAITLVGFIVGYLLGSSPHTQCCPIRSLARAGCPPRDAPLACTGTRGSGSEGHTLRGTGPLRWIAAPSRRPLPGSPWVLHSPLQPPWCTLRPCSRGRGPSWNLN